MNGWSDFYWAGYLTFAPTGGIMASGRIFSITFAGDEGHRSKGETMGRSSDEMKGELG